MTGTAAETELLRTTPFPGRPGAAPSAGMDGVIQRTWLQNNRSWIAFALLATVCTIALLSASRDVPRGLNINEGRIVVSTVKRGQIDDSIPALAAVARARDTPPPSDNKNTLARLPDVPSDDLLVIESMQVDHDFFRTLGVQPAAGRLFSAGHAADVMPPDAGKLEARVNAGVVINHKAVRRPGFADAHSAVGKTFQISLGEDKFADATVVGVVEDLHLRSIHEEITPTIFYAGDDVKVFYSFILRLGPGAQAATLAAIDRVWAGLHYRVDLSPLPFAASGLLALLIAWGTVLSHARRVAGLDAVVALRYE